MLMVTAFAAMLSFTKRKEISELLCGLIYIPLTAFLCRLTVTDLLPYLYLGNVLLKGINGSLTELLCCFLHTLLAFTLSCMITVSYQFFKCICQRQLNYMAAVICVGPIHANHA